MKQKKSPDKDPRRLRLRIVTLVLAILLLLGAAISTVSMIVYEIRQSKQRKDAAAPAPPPLWEAAQAEPPSGARL